MHLVLLSIMFWRYCAKEFYNTREGGVYKEESDNVYSEDKIRSNQGSKVSLASNALIAPSLLIHGILCSVEHFFCVTLKINLQTTRSIYSSGPYLNV